MENKNKPQWLIDAQNEIKGFEASKYGKMTDSRINSIIPLINQSKESQSMAGKKSWAIKNDAEKQKHIDLYNSFKTIEHQKKASKKGVEKNKELGNYKFFQEHATKAAAVANFNHRHNLMMEIINVLPINIEFGYEEFTIIAEKFNRKWWYIQELHKRYPELIQKIGRGKYKKVK